jgi:hypothetical protein
LHAPIKSFTHAGLSKSAYKDLLLEILIFSSYLNISTFTYGLIANDEASAQDCCATDDKVPGTSLVLVQVKNFKRP